MKVIKLKEIFNQFNHASEYDSYKELVSGHINDTYLIKTKTKPFYVLQRIDHSVFKNVPGLINNKVNVSKHLLDKFQHIPKEEQFKKVLTFVKAKDNNYFFKDKTGGYWNLMVYVSDSKTYLEVKDKEIAYEGGKLFGEFLNLTSDFDADNLIEVIPNFHSMSFRYLQFKSALQSALKKRLFKAKEFTHIISGLKDEMHILENLNKSGKIKTRVTHNDTKISNALFTKDNKGLCVIDTDTVMPGIIHYDYGDAIRTICNTAAEDEKDLTKVEFNFEFYKTYEKGFLEKTKDSLTEIELDHFTLAVKTMIFIMALRFLTDYLNNDIYYKTSYPEHNLDRAKNQFKLLKSFSQEVEMIK